MKNLFLLIITFYCIPFFPQNKFELKDLYTNPSFYPQELDIQWFNDGKSFSFISNDETGEASIFSYNITTGDSETEVTSEDLRRANNNEPFLIKNYSWSPFNNYILFTDVLPARALKTSGDFHVYSLKKKQFVYKSLSQLPQVNIKISPDEKFIAFVRGNNLLFADLSSGKETQLTFDGSENILNGNFDWVYEEEFSIIDAWEWSPDSRNIAFWRIDQSEVPVFPIISYDSLYNKVEYQYYPKAGFPVSKVKIGAVNIENKKITWMKLDECDCYIPRIKFTRNPGMLSVQKLNRMQNKLDLYFADITTGETKLILTEQDEHWVDVWDHLNFLSSSDRFIWPSERDGYLHLYLYDYKGNVINRITKGNFEVKSVSGIDEKEGVVYYTSNEQSPLNKDFYSITLDGTEKRKITSEKGTHEINLSPGCTYFIDKYSSANIFPEQLLCSINGNTLRVLNNSDASFIHDYGFTPLNFFTFKTSDDAELNAMMIKPADYDSSKKYPLIIYNYSGPGSQVVTDEWQGGMFFIFQYLVQHGFIVCAVDNRGTGGRGREFEHSVYKDLGNMEVNDIVELALYLSKSGVINPARIGIFGSSYGGYIAALSILKRPDIFKASVASSAVTDWKYYDAVYTERYMQTPRLNPEGYRRSSALNYTGKLKGKLLIVHGTADDNVHFQNSVDLAGRLIKEDKQFDFMLYPGKSHVSFGLQYLELFTDYFINNL